MTEPNDTDGRTEPSNAIEDSESNRWWVHPITGVRYLRVTTALRAVAKDALVPWASYLSSRTAFDQLPQLVAAFMAPDCGNSYNRCSGKEHPWDARCDRCPCRQCRRCLTKWLAEQHIKESSRRADEGTCAHRKIQNWIGTGLWDEATEFVDGVPYTYDRIKPYVQSFQQFIADHGLTPQDFEFSEARVLNHDEGYTGTADQGIWFDAGRSEACADICARLGKTGGRVLVLTDNKTREKPGPKLYIDHALQLVGYRRAPVLVMPDFSEVPAPAYDGTAILQLRPDGYTFRLTVSDDRTYDAFLTAIRLYKWTQEYGPQAISFYGFPLPDEYKRDKRNGKARAARAARKDGAPRLPDHPTAYSPPTGSPGGADHEIRQEVAGLVGAMIQQEARASVALDGETQTIDDVCRDPFCRGRGNGGCGRTPNEHMELFAQLGITAQVVASEAPTVDGPQAGPDGGIPQPNLALAPRILGVPPEQLMRFEGRPGASLNDSDIPY